MKRPIRKTIVWSSIIVFGIGATVALTFTRGRWLPSAQQLVARVISHPESAAELATDRDHDHQHETAEQNRSGVVRAHGDHDDEDGGHDHGEAGQDHEHEPAQKRHDENAMHLSPAARDNVGLKLAKAQLSTFDRTISVPAMIVERPGRSQIEVAAPFTGKVTQIGPAEGETVTPGQQLFELRLTHEDLVEAQSEFLKTTEELDVVKREVGRLQKVAADGAIAGKSMLERKYEQDKLEAILHSQRQRLLLHGLTAAQVDGIQASRTLVSSITVSVPGPAEPASDKTPLRLLQVETLKVQPGQHVTEGQALCILGDYTELYIEGKAFEDDVQALTKAADKNWSATAVIANSGQNATKVADLKILYLANRIDPETRAFLFYVKLPNRLLRDRSDAGHRFSDWQFRPGQRVQLLIPVEQWADRIVLPVDAVVQDGAESYVFEEHDGHFDRRSVRVEYRDQYSAVLASDGAIKPGCTVIVSGAYQVHLAMKNKAGGAIDPHAGHRH